MSLTPRAILMEIVEEYGLRCRQTSWQKHPHDTHNCPDLLTAILAWHTAQQPTREQLRNVLTVQSDTIGNLRWTRKFEDALLALLAPAGEPEKWCKDIRWNVPQTGSPGWFFDARTGVTFGNWIPSDWTVCPICTAPRPTPERG